MKKLSRKEIGDLFSRLRKESEDFADLCNERDKIVGIIEHHEIVKNALSLELEKWDTKIETIFSKALEKEIKLKN